MPDFKGRKDFPEVADAKIKIGDYSGTNRLSVTDIYSPKAEPELRDQIMEPVKGKTNNYDSPILSQQPVITLSDTDSEAALIRAINGYVAKQGDSFSDVEEKFSEPSQKPSRESHPSRAHEKGTDPRQKYKKPRNVQSQDVQKQADSRSDIEEGFGEPKRKEPREEHPSRAHEKDVAPKRKRVPRRNPQGVQKFSGDLDMKPVSTPLTTASTVPAPRKKHAGVLAPEPAPVGQSKYGDDPTGIKPEHQDRYKKWLTEGRSPTTAPTSGTPANVKQQLGGTSGASPGVGFGQGGERRKRKGVGFLGRLGRGVARFGARGAEGVARMGADASGATGIARRFGNRRVIPQEMALADILNELETYVADQQPNNSMVEQQLTKGNISKMMRNTEDKAPKDWKYHV